MTFTIKESTFKDKDYHEISEKAIRSWKSNEAISLMLDLEPTQKYVFLGRSVKLGKFETFKFLIEEKKLDFNQTTPFGNCLSIAASEGHLQFVRFLIENNCDLNAESPVYLATSERHLKIVKYLIEERNFDPNQKHTTSWRAPTPLYLACAAGYFEFVRYLVEHGADVDVVYEGNSALGMACFQKRFEIVKFLIEKGGNVNFQNDRGETPLWIASSDPDSLELVKLLIENGAFLNVPSFRSGQTPLDISKARGCVRISEFLIQKGAKTKEELI